ncbi:50S ribosomal protein L28 [Patescibacteria group bacterium]|nr:50S ribosomal protein L28 [Patescibacteria group bacterium]
MSRTCELTGKRANVANNRSHSNRATKRVQGVNLQTRRIGGVKIKLSSKALKTIKKIQAIDRGEILTKRAKKKAKTAARQEQAAKAKK